MAINLMRNRCNPSEKSVVTAGMCHRNGQRGPQKNKLPLNFSSYLHNERRKRRKFYVEEVDTTEHLSDCCYIGYSCTIWCSLPDSCCRDRKSTRLNSCH